METSPCTITHVGALRAYVGCRTSAARGARGRGIEVFELSSDGAWNRLQTVPAGENPSYLLLDEARGALHGVHGDGATISSFRVEPTGELVASSSMSTEGTNPVHLAFSACGRWLLVANYAGGSVVCLPVLADGSLGEVCHRLDLPDRPGPHRSQQRGAHPHQLVLDPSKRWLLVPDKGGDAIHTVAVDEETGSLRLASSFAAAPGSGPRHMVFSADGIRAWVVLELSSQVMALHFDPATGSMRATQRTSSVPDAFTGENTAAGIALSADGRALFVSNRGHGSVARFAIDRDSGALTSPEWIDTQGKVPRFITTAPGGDLVVANEDADTIVRIALTEFKVTPLTTTGSPVCIAFTHHVKGIS
ncbi:lactonase family protein [Variovorax sp. NFACC27]|uniref:lactonase family protein n=1 Tax=unclassified Variovorax TaxID=663243 RepID=UPI0008996EE5|nr:6-phosphogluconolactonase, cycloisomerase 2 family [Variovorax sp. NFACC28]SEG70169.1 6-phosphogluconolactonase, cycloisomerase 2 family [Variovorax sp. NFACC29]SFC83142.1 6-phosphogluconolactonase, cycloisomerase 2 family [Variovorax sp. NFACC26]SFF98068.1 6-phosphogluconolactonase, cycloisomerase 2 family [Variovorax sp. NFACC27]